MIGGFALTVPIYLLTDGVGRWLGYTAVSAVTVFPLAVSMIGWIELLGGIGFADISARFDRGGILLKLAIGFLVLWLIAVYFGIGIWAYRRYG